MTGYIAKLMEINLGFNGERYENMSGNVMTQVLYYRTEQLCLSLLMCE